MRLLLVSVAALAAVSACGPAANTPPAIANAPGGASPSVEQAVTRGDAAAAAVIASVKETPVGQSSFSLAPTDIVIADQTAIFTALGFEMSGKDIVVDSTNPSGVALGKLGLVLKLANYPDILKSPGPAALYSAFLDAEECKTYFQGSRCDIWKGTTQFEREDSHKAFVAAWEPKLREMIPAFPFTVLEKRSALLGPYADNRQQLMLAMVHDSDGDGGVWRNHAGLAVVGPVKAGLAMPLPLAYGQALNMAHDDARTLMEDLAEKGAEYTRDTLKNLRLTVGTRYLATGIRPNDRAGSILDLLVYSRALYIDETLAAKALDLPLGSTALTVEPQPSSTEPAYFDNMLPRILAAKLRPALLDDEAFLRETLKLRAAAEQFAVSMQGSRPEATFSNWPAMAPAALREHERLSYSPEDIARTRAWIADAAKRIGNTARVKYVCGNEQTTTRCGSPSQEVSNGHLFSPAAALSRSNAAGVPKNPPENRPASQGFFTYQAGSGIKVVYSQSASPHWFGVDVPFDWKAVQHVSMDLTILSASFVPTADGEVLLVDIAPRSFAYTEIGGAPTTFDLSTIPLPAAPQASATGGYYEIAGITIGMPLAEAEAKAAAALPAHFEKTETDKPKHFGLTNSMAWKDPTGKSREKIEIFFDPEDSQRRVTGIGRIMPTQSGPDASQNRATASTAMMDRLDEKYGPSDTNHKQGGISYWVADPVQKARFAAERDNRYAHGNRCKFDKLQLIGQVRPRPFFEGDIPASCGEILAAAIHSDTLTMFALDTTHYNNQRQRQMKNQKPDAQLNDAPL